MKKKIIIVLIINILVYIGFINIKQGFHEDELLSYNLANSNTHDIAGKISDKEDLINYLTVDERSKI